MNPADERTNSRSFAKKQSDERWPVMHKIRRGVCKEARCRVWSGPWKVGQKDNKKKIGVNVAINIRADRMKDFSEEAFVREVSELLQVRWEARSSVMKRAEHQVTSLCYDYSNIMAIKYTLST
jgi:hypothetical protein